MGRTMRWKIASIGLAIESAILAANCATRSPSPPSSAGAASQSEPSTLSTRYPPPPFVAQYIREHGLCARDAAAPEAAAARPDDDGNDAGKPRIEMGASEMKGGRLPPEVIQYIVRQKYDRLRDCYETGMRENPDLQGHVTTRFVIERDGTVTHVSNEGSDLPDPDALACMSRVFETMCFPPVENGIIRVVYPIFYSPESDDGG